MEEPLLHPPTAAAAEAAATIPSTATISARLAAFAALAAVSVWANYEASKGFEISVVNAAAGSPMGDRFALMFVSNGRASRIIHGASRSVERALYPDDHRFPRKPVRRLTLLLASHNLSAAVSVTAADDPGAHYTVHLSLGFMSATAKADAAADLAALLHFAVARVWLWDGRRAAPPALLDAVAEYLAVEAGFPPRSNGADSLGPDGACWSQGFLRYCEGRSSGFVAELNRAMKEPWAGERALDDRLGLPVREMCAAYRVSAAQRIGSGETGHAM